MDIMYTFLVDFARPQRTNELLVMQNDALTRVARFVLMNNGKALDVSDVDAVTINAVLPDESRITAEAQLLTDEDGDPLNEIIYAIPASMTAAIGKTVLTISLYSAEVVDEETQEVTEPAKLLSSFDFYVNTRNELNKDDGSGEDDYAGIRDLINRALEAVAVVEQLISQSALPNPYPLRLILENTRYNYDGSAFVEVDFGNIISRIAALESAFPDGCRIIANAITAGRGTVTNPIDGVTTAATASPNTMAANIKEMALKNYNSGLQGAQGVTPAFTQSWSTRTAGTQATLTTKTTTAGWTKVNDVQATNTTAVTAQINTTGDDQVHDFNIVPNLYHKAKVNQKPAYDAGYDVGFEEGVNNGHKHYQFTATHSSQTGSTTVRTATLDVSAYACLVAFYDVPASHYGGFEYIQNGGTPVASGQHCYLNLSGVNTLAFDLTVVGREREDLYPEGTGVMNVELFKRVLY